MLTSKSAVAVVVALAVIHVEAQSKIPVNVYYESLCPDSAKFINEQLYPAMQQFRGNVDLKLIPFGKSSYRTQGSETTFECHHGPNECYGNKVHACAIQHIESSSYEPNNTKEVLTLNYVNCLMERAQLKSGEFPGESCARDTDIRNWENIAACANDTEGSDLLRKAGDETNKLQKPLTSVPTVAFRQTYDRDTQTQAVDNFRAALCKNLNPAPVACRNIPGGAPALAASFGLVTLVSAVLTRLL
uniref:Putative gamma-interferon inducible lysosomal thiol reductase-like protein n=1 Tax=Culex tarsalis TaxID=7177 RepID=A0A1Q3FLF9_CULTA